MFGKEKTLYQLVSVLHDLTEMWSIGGIDH